MHPSVHSTSPFGIRHLQFAGEFIGGLAGRWELNQVENRAALLLGQPGLATSTRLHPQSVEAAVIEGLQAFADRLRMAAQRFGNLAGTQPIPAVGHDLGMKDPVGGRMHAMRQFPDFTFFNRVYRWTRSQMFGHGAPPCPLSAAYSVPALRNTAMTLFCHVGIEAREIHPLYAEYC